MRKFKIPTNPYDDRKMYDTGNFTFSSGITVLVGCNGSGKSTLMLHIKDKLQESNTPFLYYDNLFDGNSTSVSSAMLAGDTETAAALLTASEGERIYINIGRMAARIGSMVRNAKAEDELWILMDATDSGLSIDNAAEIKEFFKNVLLPDAPENTYIIISANAYEMCRGELCMDVYDGNYMRFSDYEEYRNHILMTRDRKDGKR